MLAVEQGALQTILHPFLLYGLCVLGAIGVALASPRERVAPFIIGAIIAAGAFGGLLIGLGVVAVRQGAGNLPSWGFYIFSFMALLSALRVITHQRPIYAALWFILTIVSSCGLYVLLQAEFMAFALVIVYGGAILITYLFVIMLATDGPSEEAVEAMSAYDRSSREPVAATFAGFVLLAVLTTLLAGGSMKLGMNPALAATDKNLAVMPEKVERALREAGLLTQGERVARRERADGKSELALDATIDGGSLQIIGADGKTARTLDKAQWPEALRLDNTQRVAFELMEANPGAIEIAGVILLMAMVGAVVLARKKVELDEAAKVEAIQRAREQSELGREAPFVQPATGGNN